MEADAIQRNREAWAARCGRTASPEDWAPFPPQSAFLELGCFEALYGGAAGGGKTDAGLVFLAAGVGQGAERAYQALFLRRTYPELEKWAIPRARELYPKLGGVERDNGTEWRFPGGEVIRLEHCEHESNVTRYQGAPFTRVFFDELTTFTERIYLYLFSRVRSAAGAWCGIRASANPGGIGHEWVRRRFLDWVSRMSKRSARAGEVRYFVRRGDDDVEVPKGTPDALGRTFIPAKLQDNPALMIADPQYAARIKAMGRLDSAQLLDGDWDAVPAPKDMWDRTKSRVLTHRPLNSDVTARARAWDIASTPRPDADATSGTLMCATRFGRFALEHAVHARLSPDGVDALMLETAEADWQRDPRTVQVIALDPGAAGKVAVAHYQRLLAKYPIKIVTISGDKPTRFSPCSSRQRAGFIDVVDDGTWDVDAHHTELELFPTPKQHDDRVDATADAYNAVVTGEVPSVSSALAAFSGFSRRGE